MWLGLEIPPSYPFHPFKSTLPAANVIFFHTLSILLHFHLQIMNQIMLSVNESRSTEVEASFIGFNKHLKSVYGLTRLKCSLGVDKVTLEIC